MTKNSKDAIIARQSMSRLALDYFNTCNICPSLADLIKVTTMLEKFVTDGYSKDMVDKFESMDSFIAKEYKG